MVTILSDWCLLSYSRAVTIWESIQFENCRRLETAVLELSLRILLVSFCELCIAVGWIRGVLNCEYLLLEDFNSLTLKLFVVDNAGVIFVEFILSPVIHTGGRMLIEFCSKAECAWIWSSKFLGISYWIYLSVIEVFMLVVMIIKTFFCWVNDAETLAHWNVKDVFRYIQLDFKHYFVIKRHDEIFKESYCFP